MNALVKIEVRELSGATVQTVNARDLWEFVESKQDFSTWIKSRIEKYSLVEGEDYLLHKFMEQLPSGAKQKIDYILAIETGKELAMVENNEKGRQVRRYFIECERKAKEQPAIDPMKVLGDPAAMRGLLLGYTERVIELESKVAIIQPKSDALDRIATHSEGSHCIRDAAAILQVREKALYSLLSDAGWIYKRPTGSGWLAYGPVRAKMLMEHKVTAGQKDDGSEWKTEQPRITARGMAKIALMIESGQMQGKAA